MKFSFNWFIFLLLILGQSLFTENVFARPIFAKFVLEPIDSPKEEVSRELEQKFLKHLKPKEFENLLSTEDQNLLRKALYTESREEYDALILETIEDGDIDLLFDIKITNVRKDENKVTFSIKNTQKKVLFFRESVYDYVTADDYFERIKRWMIEFKNVLPPVGEIIARGNGKVEIKLIHGSALEDYKSRPFFIGGFDFAYALEDRNYTSMGAITNIKDGIFEAYVYQDYRGNTYKKGDYLIFLDKVREGVSIQSSDNVVVSETWFNYLNSPKFSLLDCSLLPVFGTAPYLKELHENMVSVINKEKLCKFRSDIEVSKILQSYDDNLEEYLNNEDVMRKLAKVLRVGALFRMGIYKLNSGVSIKFDVIAENGKTVYFSRYEVIEKFDDEYITELVLGWIIDYKKSLPLSGKVVQIRGKTLLIDIPSGLVEGTKKEFEIVRPISFKYEEVGGNRKLSWRKDIIAYGEILRVKKLHSIGNVFKFVDKKNKVRVGDWVYIKDLDYNIKEEWYLTKKHNIKNDRGIGRAKLSTEITSVNVESANDVIYGAGLGFDFFLPKGFLFSGEVVRNLNGGDQSISNNNLTIGFGYSFTPRIYSDYLSFVDLSVGYRTANYSLGNFDDKLIGNLKYAGAFIGARIEVPVYKKFALQFQSNFIPSDGVENSNPTLGSAKRSIGLELFFIGKYKWTKTERFFVEFHQKSYKTTYEVDSATVSLNASLIKLGYGVDF